MRTCAKMRCANDPTATVALVYADRAVVIVGLLAERDPNLLDLFQLYGASPPQTLRFLKLPAALPYILGGLRIAGGLSLIGAVVAEIAAGTAGAGSGLAYRIAESGYRLNIPRMFAALLLLSLAGIVIYGVLALVSHLVLRRWHESALGKEN